MQEDGRLTTVIRLQTVFVGLLKPNYYNVILQDKGKETPFRWSVCYFDASPHRQSQRLQKLPNVQMT